MATIGDGIKSVLLAGIGAMAIGAEKGKELVDSLVERGELTVDQGKQINTELKHRAAETMASARNGALEARLAVMTPEERSAFAEQVAALAQAANERDAQKAADKVAAAQAAASAEGASAGEPAIEVEAATPEAVPSEVESGAPASNPVCAAQPAQPAADTPDAPSA